MEAIDFEKLGLNKNEARVYYELLKIGSSNAADLVKHMGIHRNIVYDNLEKLITKGLVSYIIEESKKLFIAQEPLSILEYLNKKEEEISREKEIAKKIILDIQQLRLPSPIGQEVEIFRGISGMKKVLLEVLTSNECFVLGMTNKSTELLGEIFWKNYNAKVKDRKITERLLLNSDFEDIYSFKKNKRIKVKVLPKELNQITEIILFNGNVAIFIYSEKPLAILTKETALYDTYLKQFEFLWKLSKNA